MEPVFAALVGCYGDHAAYSVRCVDSILDNAADRSSFELHVGCNACGAETIAALRKRYDAGAIDTLVESRENINKDPMMRLLVERTTAPYVLWFDDDSHVRKDWDRHVVEFVNGPEFFDCAGHVHYCHRTDEYRGFLRRRPWWRGEESYLEVGHRERVWFATGGLFLARTAFLRRHNFPDRAMGKKQDDLLLGDMVSQVGGRLVNFPQDLMNAVVISDGDRRGDGEGRDGWLDRDPVTGE
jgi:hypothetical protein